MEREPRTLTTHSPLRNFSFRDLPPGRYRIFATEVPGNYFRSEEFFATFGAAISSITLTPGVTLPLNLTLITIPAVVAAGIELDR